MAVSAQADEVHRLVSTALDPAFYRTTYPDVAAAGEAPLAHYLRAGWREGRDPAPWFSVEAYLADNPDVRDAGLEPFSHFLGRGAREGRDAPASRHAPAYAQRSGGWQEPWSFSALDLGLGARRRHPEAERALAATAFDAGYYLACQPDVAASGADPVAHFLARGWIEGRDPAPWFSLDHYLYLYPDVAAQGVNPFLHYLREGREEGRATRRPNGYRFDMMLRSGRRADPAPMIEAARQGRRGLAGVLSGRLEAAARTRLADLHVTFSHDDYTASLGGVQLCIRREAARFAERGVDHLHLHPASGWRLVREPGEPGLIGVMLNGEPLGAYAAEDASAAIHALARRVAPGRRSFAIHSLLGHTPEDVAELLEGLELTAGYFWLHDFASLCAGFHLLRNDVEDCGAPPPESRACELCAYGGLRARHVDAHRRLFQRLALTAVAPSRATLDFWRARQDLPLAGAVVLPHARMRRRGPAAPGFEPRLRVAFVGAPLALKGWELFRELANAHAGDPRYRFLHVGSAPDPETPAVFHPAAVSEDAPTAMRDALEGLAVDVALIWPLCRETFSFTAHEAAAAGAAVVTGPDSGNVAAFVDATGLGVVLGSEEALLDAFRSGEILSLARDRRVAESYDLAFSGLTADLVAA